MHTNLMRFILCLILAQALAACGAATIPAAEPTPTPEPTASVDIAAIAQSFYKALNEGDFEAAMALVADDVQCRGGCFVDGKEAFREWLLPMTGGQVEISEVTVDGNKVTYNWTATSDEGGFEGHGVATLTIRNGKIALMEFEIR